MDNQKKAIFITEAPDFNEEQGTEFMTWIVFTAMEIDDDSEDYTRCFTIEAAFEEADQLKRKHPDYEYVGLT